jgi:hypothetical protein
MNFSHWRAWKISLSESDAMLDEVADVLAATGRNRPSKTPD